MKDEYHGKPLLYKRVRIPDHFCAKQDIAGKKLCYGGDLRIGDLTGNGQADFLIFRSVEADSGNDELVGMKPCFMAAFDINGTPLWSVGNGGKQPERPGPVAVYDIDADGEEEIICFFIQQDKRKKSVGMENVVIQIRSGKTGEIKKQAAPPVFRKCNGYSANWVHHRILIANLRGNKTAQDFIVKLGHKILAFTDELKLLWDYDILWNEYQHCSAYIPSVGDIDRDGKDEINGGYFLLDDDGTPLWEKKLGMNMDSVAVAEWDEGNIRAFCSGYGHIVDEKGNVILCLGKNVVPHGQELRVGRFRVSGCDEPQMVIRSHGHETKAVVVNNNGKIEYEFELNPSSNNTGMETVRWNGVQGPDLLYNAGMLWNLSNRTEMPLPGLPPARGERVMGWYHCIPADICGDEREELIVYNPWDSFINIYTPAPFIPEEYDRYISGARQYNARFMD